jgi:hypothetical protein
MRSAVAALLVSAGVAAADDSDIQRASELYKTAEAEMKAGNFEQAALDYGAAYEASKDPALLFKLGSANEKAGNCKVAVMYFRRYLGEGKPSDAYVKLTKERIEACGPATEPPVPPPGLPSPPPGLPSPPPGLPSPSPKAPLPRGHGSNAAWLTVGATVAFVVTGGVLAYSASSSEEDMKDLYVGLQGMPPTYDATTQKRYQDLLDEGHRYEHLAWASFGLAAAAAGVSVYLFTRHNDEVTPVVAPGTIGAQATIHF